MRNYGRLNFLFHRLALGSITMRRIAFDVDCLFSGSPAIPTQPRAPVYVTGLARSGTTVLLEALYASRAFATLTYRAMPFVTAPQLWSQISSNMRCEGNPRERAHGDKMSIGFDSPEAFEEPFWTMLTDERFIHADGLDVHNVGDTGLEDYRRYITNVLLASKMRDARYLAKNNNNVLRIDSLLRAFPDAHILVPFRNPWDHAESLLRQHRRFSAMHAKDGTTLSYMNWLGHFEFGANFKPFKVDLDVHPRNADEINTEDYWLRYWTCVYRYLLNMYKNKVVFFDYDRFCREPVRTLECLAATVDLEPGQLTGYAANVREQTVYPDNDLAGRAVSDTADLYAALQKSSMQAL